MVDQSDIEVVEASEETYAFRVRDPSVFAEYAETPAWVQDAAETVSDGATVEMGRLPDGDALQVARVEVPRKPTLGREEAKNAAEKIREEIRSP